MNNNQTSVDDTTDDNTKVTAPSDTSDGTTGDDVTTTDTPSIDEPIVDEPVADDGRDYFSDQTIANPINVRNSFESVNSVIAIESGDTFSVTDSANASITLERTAISNEDVSSVFLNIVNSPNTTLTFKEQVAEGDIVLDGLSSLNFILNGESYYMGIINGGNTAQSVSITIDDTSQLVLAGNTYISELKNTDTANTNIYSNGYKLYVAGEEVAVNGSAAPKIIENEVTEDEIEYGSEEATTGENAAAGSDTNLLPFIVGGVAILVIIIAIIVFILHNKKKKSGPTDGMDIDTGASGGSRPDFSQFDDGPAQQGSTFNEPVQPPTTPPEPPVSQTPPNPTTPPPSDPHAPYVGQM
jgi:hypothetical protein